MWALQAIRGEMPFEPQPAGAVIQSLGDWEVNHGAIIPHPARWLHMSQFYIKNEGFD
jgi:hypothetical protein